MFPSMAFIMKVFFKGKGPVARVFYGSSFRAQNDEANKQPKYGMLFDMPICLDICLRLKSNYLK